MKDKWRYAQMGIDSLYLRMEYPKDDIYKTWMSLVGSPDNPRLYGDGIEHHGTIIKAGANGYKLALWDGDARLYITDRVDNNLKGSKYENQGMGLFLQLGPKWLTKYAPWGNTYKLVSNSLGQFTAFGVMEAEKYPVRIKRLDPRMDVLGMPFSEVTAHLWNPTSPHCQWVGYAKPHSLYFGEGIKVGKGQGAVKFKVYDKTLQAQQQNIFRFWRSVWGLEPDDDDTPVTRFEWTIDCYKARFEEMRYLHEFSYKKLYKIVNYLIDTWGRLATPIAGDSNRSRWPNAPLWDEIRTYSIGWNMQTHGQLQRVHDYRPEIRDEYLRTLAGWLSGYMARLGIENKQDCPASLYEALDFLQKQGITLEMIEQKAGKKHKHLSILTGTGGS